MGSACGKTIWEKLQNQFFFWGGGGQSNGETWGHKPIFRIVGGILPIPPLGETLSCTEVTFYNFGTCDGCFCGLDVTLVQGV